ncbi:MAG: hypothetical protein LBC33_01250, partial [Mycoplasmataceae bacterium]|nr:hypothetical protein [Mycoplasmataceae bacterium]
LVALGDFIDVTGHALEICSLYAQRDNLDHHLKSEEYKSIIELCKWIGADDEEQYQSVDLNDLELVEADVVDEDSGTASKLNFKDEYNHLVNELNLMTNAEDISLNNGTGDFNWIFGCAAAGIKVLSSGIDLRFTTEDSIKKINKGILILSVARTIMSGVNALIVNYTDNVLYSWFFDFLTGSVIDAISQYFTIAKFAHEIKILREASSVTNCRKLGRTLNKDLGTTLFKTNKSDFSFWYDKKPNKLGRRIKNKPHINFKPDLARKLLTAAIIFGIIITITDWATDIWYNAACQKDYVLICDWEQWKKQNMKHATR